MEILVELLFEVVAQFVVEVLFEAGFRGVARFLANRVVRALLGATLAGGAGYGGGYWWGSRLTELGRVDPPKALWVSIGLAVLFSALAVFRATSAEADRSEARAQWRERVWPWRWSPMRLLGFALLNSAIAAGIVVGFTPRP